MEISKDRINSNIRNDRLHFDEFEASYNRKLETANKARNNRQLFLEGLSWCSNGRRLEDADENKKNNISFKRGFEEGLYQEGFRYGYNYMSYEEIPEFFSVHDKCRAGYYDGEKRRLLDDSKSGAKAQGR